MRAFARRAGRIQALSVFTIGRIQYWLAIIPFLMGALYLVLKATLADPDAAENIIEWIFALLMHVYFVLSFVAWKETGFATFWRTGAP